MSDRVQNLIYLDLQRVETISINDRSAFVTGQLYVSRNILLADGSCRSLAPSHCYEFGALTIPYGLFEFVIKHLYNIGNNNPPILVLRFTWHFKKKYTVTIKLYSWWQHLSQLLCPKWTFAVSSLMCPICYTYAVLCEWNYNTLMLFNRLLGLKKHQWIHQWPIDFPHKGSGMGKCCYGAIMTLGASLYGLLHQNCHPQDTVKIGCTLPFLCSGVWSLWDLWYTK